MNKYFQNLETAIKQDSKEYEILVNLIESFREFTIDDIYRALNRKLPKGDKVPRYKVVDTLRVLIKNKLIQYDLNKQLMTIKKAKQ